MLIGSDIFIGWYQSNAKSIEADDEVEQERERRVQSFSLSLGEGSTASDSARKAPWVVPPVLQYEMSSA